MRLFSHVKDIMTRIIVLLLVIVIISFYMCYTKQQQENFDNLNVDEPPQIWHMEINGQKGHFEPSPYPWYC